MRVTSSMMVRSTLRDLSQGLSRLQETQTKLATGKEITSASSNPGRSRTSPSTITATAPRRRAHIAQRSPMIAAWSSPPAELTIPSPGSTKSSEAIAARLSMGPHSAVTAVPQNFIAGCRGLMPWCRLPRPLKASVTNPVGVSRKR